MCSLIEELQINHVYSGWSWEASQALPLAVLLNVSLLEEEYHVVTNFLGCIPNNILCEVYLLKISEGMV